MPNDSDEVLALKYGQVPFYEDIRLYQGQRDNDEESKLQENKEVEI